MLFFFTVFGSLGDDDDSHDADDNGGKRVTVYLNGAHSETVIHSPLPTCLPYTLYIV